MRREINRGTHVILRELIMMPSIWKVETFQNGKNDIMERRKFKMIRSLCWSLNATG